MPVDLACPACGSTELIIGAVNHAQCGRCLFFCHIAADGQTTEDLETTLDVTKWTLDDMVAHPETMKVLAQRMAKFSGVRVSDEQAAAIVANHLDDKLPKPSGSKLA